MGSRIIWMEDSGGLDWAALFVNGVREWQGHASDFEVHQLVKFTPITTIEVRYEDSRPGFPEKV